MAASAAADGSSADTALRRVAGAMLLAGGALALIAAFLPFGRIDWPAIPAENVVIIPVHPALASLGAPLENIYSLCVAALFLLGLPVALAALGVATLWARRAAPGWRGFVIAFPMVALEVSYIAFNALFVLVPASPNFPGVTRTLEYGAYVMALGAALALIGTILLPRVTSRAAGVSSFAQGV